MSAIKFNRPKAATHWSRLMLLALGVTALSGCALFRPKPEPPRPLPTIEAETLRPPCQRPALPPIEGLTVGALADVSTLQEAAIDCNEARAVGLLDLIDRHNARVSSSGKGN